MDRPANTTQDYFSPHHMGKAGLSTLYTPRLYPQKSYHQFPIKSTLVGTLPLPSPQPRSTQRPGRFTSPYPSSRQTASFRFFLWEMGPEAGKKIEACGQQRQQSREGPLTTGETMGEGPPQTRQAGQPLGGRQYGTKRRDQGSSPGSAPSWPATLGPGPPLAVAQAGLQDADIPSLLYSQPPGAPGP